MENSALTVYNASAGSGKTFTIAAEYIAILLEGGENMHRRILAVTFTNKATEEMKSRILENLEKLAKDNDPDDDFLKAVRERLPKDFDEDKIRSAAKKALNNLLHDYDNFNIMTIDAFFQWLLALLAQELGLTAEYKINLNSQLAIEKGVERLLQRAKSDEGLLKMLVKYVQGKISENKSWDISREIATFAKQLYKEEYMLHEDSINQSLNENDIDKLKENFQKQCKDIKDEWIKQATELEDYIVNNCGSWEKYNGLKKTLGGYLNKLKEGNNENPSDAVQRLAANSPSDDIDRSTSLIWLKKGNRKEWADIVPMAENIRLKLNQLINYVTASSEIYNTAQLALLRLNPLCLLNETRNSIEQVNEEEGHFMLAKTPKLFYDLVQGVDAPFVFEKAGTRYSHVLIDEFQDTSQIQWQNFKTLLLGNLSQGDRCLLVGDVKQSIYRFRGGDYRLLQNINNDMGYVKPKFVSLDTNFRSTDEIIAFNNAFFPSAAQVLFGKGDDTTTDEQWMLNSVYHTDGVGQKDRGKTGGIVWLEGIEVEEKGKRDKTAEGDEEIAESDNYEVERKMGMVVTGLHRQGLPYSEIAILVRYTSEAKSILSYFAENHPEVPISSDEAFLLSASSAVQTLVHALKYKMNHQDTIAEAFVRRYAKDQFAEMKDLFTETKGKNLYELCELLIKRLGLNRDKNETPYLLYFLDQVLDFVTSKPGDIAVFLKQWDETLNSKPIPGGEVDGIRILTIHKSKGLAFHTVMVPFCDWEIEKDRNDDLIWCETKKAPFDQLPLLPIPTNSKYIKNSDFKAEYQHEHLQQRIENLNLLYVAFTRPKHNLYAWYKVKVSKDEDKATEAKQKNIADIIHAAIHKDGVKGKISPAIFNPDYTYKSKTDETKDNQLGCAIENHKERYQFVQSNQAMQFVNELKEGKVDSYLDRGKMYHALLSEVKTANDINAVCRKYAKLGLLGKDIDEASMQAYLTNRLKFVENRGWFDHSWTLKNECEILYRDKEGNYKTCRPDRVMIQGKQAIVVDYKSGKYRSQDTKTSKDYHEQVREYMQHLQSMGYEKTEGYLWYIDAEVIESVCIDQA